MDERQIMLVRKKIASLRDNKVLFTKISYESKWTPSVGFITKFKSIPNVNTVKAAALDIRHFLSQESNINMLKILNQLHKIGTADKLKVAEFRKAWLARIGEKKPTPAPFGIVIVLNDEELTLKRQIDLWVNGDLFHGDIEKMGTLQTLDFVGSKELSYMIFVSTLQDLTRALFYFEASFVEK